MQRDLFEDAPSAVVHAPSLPPIKVGREVELRPYQADAVNAVEAAVLRKASEVVVMPTGSGKSLVIAGVADRFKDAHIIVLQPTREILEQNLARYQAFGGVDADVFSASLNRKRRGSRLTFATIGSIISKLPLFQGTDLVIVDEAHLVNARDGQYKRLIEHFGVPVVGLTATPYRMHSWDKGRHVTCRFLHSGLQRIFTDIAHVVQVPDLHRDGYLCDVEWLEPYDDYDTGCLALNSTGLNYDAGSVHFYHRRIGFTQRVVEVIRLLLAAGSKHVLVFAQSCEESREIAYSFALDNIEVAHVDATTPSEKRRSIISRFRSGEIRVVCNVGVLTVGFDFPELDAVVLARPTMSVLLYYQMVGRGVRVAPGKERLRVVDLCGITRRFGQVEKWTIECRGKDWRLLRDGGVPLTDVDFVTGEDYVSKHVLPDQASRVVVNFGKYSGTLVSQLPTGYLLWMAKEFKPGYWKNVALAELGKRRKKKEANG